MQGKPRKVWMGNIKTWTGLPVEDSVTMTEDGMANRKGGPNPRSNPLGQKPLSSSVVGLNPPRTKPP